MTNRTREKLQRDMGIYAAFVVLDFYAQAIRLGWVDRQGAQHACRKQHRRIRFRTQMIAFFGKRP